METTEPTFIITKANGEQQPFSQPKFMRSLERSGADETTINSVLTEIRERLYDGITTKKIYEIAHRLLKKNSKKSAGKYHLKRGIMELGPSGYPFEKYIGEIFRYQGFDVQTAAYVQGRCVSHEVDVIALKGKFHYMIECKYHNQPGTVSTVKIPLYIQSRFRDIESIWRELPGHANKIHEGWVVTNTRFTRDAIDYGTCVGLRLLGWDYPAENNLNSIIDKFGLYPLTCLSSLKKNEKIQLLEAGIVLCLDLCKNENQLVAIGMPRPRINQVLTEGHALCSALKIYEH